MTKIKANFYEITVAPSGDLGLLDLLKENLGIDYDTSDVLLQLQLDAAANRIAQMTNLVMQDTVFNGFYSYAERTRYDWVNCFVPVEKAIATAVNEVALWDSTTSLYVAVDTEDYTVEEKIGYWRVFLNNTLSVTNTDCPPEPYPIRVDFNAGYADGEIPPELQLAIVQYASWLFTARGDCGACGCASVNGILIPNSIWDLISGLTVRRVFA